jgi:aminoglycoside phosphotransferase (APT) family kinase protein
VGDAGVLAGQAITAGARGGAVTSKALFAFVAKQGDLGGKIIGVEIDQTPRKAGASSGTVLFEAQVQTENGTRALPLVFRYDLGGAFFKQYALAPQFWTMRAVHASGFPLPKPLWLDEAGEVAGHPGMIMQRVRGAAPTITPFNDGPLMAVGPAERRTMLLNAARTLARLHSVDPRAVSHLDARGEGANFIARDVNWVLFELRHTVNPLRTGPKAAFYNHASETLERIARYLLSEAPDRPPELAHGDANITNFMYDGVEVAALLDYELSHIGLGEADLGYQLAGFSHFRLLAPPVDGVPSDEEMVDAYASVRGKLADWPYARLMGEWRHATFATMGMTRLPPELAHVERAYWDAAVERMHRIAPDVVAMERAP